MRHRARWLIATLLIGGIGCNEAPGSPDEMGPAPVPIAEDAGVDCARPAEGCACDPGASPIDCYLDPLTTPDGQRMCREGTRYCRDGRWTGCESIHEYVVRGSATSLIDGPSECNPCDPTCMVSRDIPTAPDVTPGNSSGVEYDGTLGGVVIPPSGTALDMLPDTDGDGVPDDFDNFPMDPARDGFTENGGLFHVLGFGDTAGPDSLTFSTTIQTADIYFVIDRTGSMDDEIANVRNDLTTGTFRTGCAGGIIGAVQCIIPDAYVGASWFGEYPVYPYGDDNDVVWRNVSDLTGDVAAVQTAVNGITTNGNIDWEEAATQAIHSAVTGLGLGTYAAARTTCPAGTWGWPCFRDGAIPILVVITDAPTHNGPNTDHDYDLFPFDYSTPTPVAVSGNDTYASSATGTRNLGNVNGAWVSRSGSTNSPITNNYDLGCGAGARDAVIRFSLSAPQRTVISLAGSSYDTVLAVVDATTFAGWCNDDSANNTSLLVLDLPAGNYYAIIDGYGTARGNYRISVGDPCAVAGNCDYQPPTWADTVAALRARNVRVVGVESSGHPTDTDALSNLEELGIATDSVDDLGDPFVFSIATNGSGISGAVVDAIEELANYSRMDITARALDNAATPLVDERDFVQTLSAVSYPAGRCEAPGIAADGVTFTQCLPGTSVVFEATFFNDVVAPTMAIQVFDFTIEIVGDGTFVLDSVPVRIVVPPDRIMYPPQGVYWRDYDSTMSCLGNERPDWQAFTWDVATPNLTSIRFELRTADTVAELDTATPVTFTVPGTSPPVDVGALLVSAGQANRRPYLRVTAVLLSNADLSDSPILRSFEQTFVCSPAE